MHLGGHINMLDFIGNIIFVLITILLGFIIWRLTKGWSRF